MPVGTKVTGLRNGGRHWKFHTGCILNINGLRNGTIVATWSTKVGLEGTQVSIFTVDLHGLRGAAGTVAKLDIGIQRTTGAFGLQPHSRGLGRGVIGPPGPTRIALNECLGGFLGQDSIGLGHTWFWHGLGWHGLGWWKELLLWWWNGRQRRRHFHGDWKVLSGKLGIVGSTGSRFHAWLDRRRSCQLLHKRIVLLIDQAGRQIHSLGCGNSRRGSKGHLLVASTLILIPWLGVGSVAGGTTSPWCHWKWLLLDWQGGSLK
mmetsp:Transcript_34777/g.84294  ORF Transcript_34777/g.84294 Transcript_34777/m.84294 type:complete len:261 (+) Transcript_34777:575-1357(+)